MVWHGRKFHEGWSLQETEEAWLLDSQRPEVDGSGCQRGLRFERAACQSRTGLYGFGEGLRGQEMSRHL